MTITRPCNYCQESYQAEQRYLNRGQGYYCSRRCSGYAIQSSIPKAPPNVTCAHCGISFYKNAFRVEHNKNDVHFCTRQHKDLAARLESGDNPSRPAHWGSGKTSYRQRAFRTYGKRCSMCLYSEDSRMLDVDHIDSDRKNNVIDNLQVLCVWCHALKTRANWPKEE